MQAARFWYNGAVWREWSKKTKTKKVIQQSKCVKWFVHFHRHSLSNWSGPLTCYILGLFCCWVFQQRSSKSLVEGNKNNTHTISTKCMRHKVLQEQWNWTHQTCGFNVEILTHSFNRASKSVVAVVLEKVFHLNTKSAIGARAAKATGRAPATASNLPNNMSSQLFPGEDFVLTSSDRAKR